MCTPDRSDLKLGTVVVLDTMSTDSGSEVQGSGSGLVSRCRFTFPERVFVSSSLALFFELIFMMLRHVLQGQHTATLVNSLGLGLTVHFSCYVCRFICN